MHRNACAHFKGFTDLKSFLVLKVIWWCLFLTAADNIYAFPHCVSSSWLSKPFSHSSWSDIHAGRGSDQHLGASSGVFQALRRVSQAASRDFKCCPAARPHLRQLLSHAVSAWQMQATSAPLYENTFGEVFNSGPLLYAAPLKCNAHWYSTV